MCYVGESTGEKRKAGSVGIQKVLHDWGVQPLIWRMETQQRLMKTRMIKKVCCCWRLGWEEIEMGSWRPENLNYNNDSGGEQENYTIIIGWAWRGCLHFIPWAWMPYSTATLAWEKRGRGSGNFHFFFPGQFPNEEFYIQAIFFSTFLEISVLISCTTF